MFEGRVEVKMSHDPRTRSALHLNRVNIDYMGTDRRRLQQDTDSTNLTNMNINNDNNESNIGKNHMHPDVHTSNLGIAEMRPCHPRH